MDKNLSPFYPVFTFLLTAAGNKGACNRKFQVVIRHARRVSYCFAYLTVSRMLGVLAPLNGNIT